MTKNDFLDRSMFVKFAVIIIDKSEVAESSNKYMTLNTSGSLNREHESGS